MISAVRTTGRWSILKRFRRDRNGTTAVEFGLVAMPFFAILGMIIETGLAFFTGQVLEAATTSAGRIVMTGQVQLTPGPPAIRIARFRNEFCNRFNWYIDCNSVQFDVRSFPMGAPINMALPIVNGALDPNQVPQFNFGNPGQIVLIRIYYEMPIYLNILGVGTGVLSGNKRLLTGAVAFMNEPY